MSVKMYEAMFLLTQPAASNLGEAVNHVKGLLDRAGADVIGMYKWDERKLAYTIKGQRRGTFLLSYFNVDGEKLGGLDRDCNLSEQVLRAMVTTADHLGEEELTAFKTAVDESNDAKIVAGKALNTEPKEESADAGAEKAPAPAPAAAAPEAKAAPAEPEAAAPEAAADEKAEEAKADA